MSSVPLPDGLAVSAFGERGLRPVNFGRRTTVAGQRRTVCRGIRGAVCWDASDGRHRRDLPVLRHIELCRERGTVKCPELAYMQPQRLRLEGHVRDGLPQVVHGELRVVPFGVLDETVREVADEQTRCRCPPRPEEVDHELAGAHHGHTKDEARAFYTDPFGRLRLRRITSRRRLYGPDFAVDEAVVDAETMKGQPAPFRLLRVFEFADGRINRESAWQASVHD